MAAVDDRACAQEQQGLEERVRDQVKHPYGDPAYAEAHHHVAQLRNSGVSKNALDVRLRDRDQRREQRGDGAGPCNNLQSG